ncbi:hypothetical protein [Arthrobacter sp. D1-17]
MRLLKVSTSRRFIVALPDFIFALCALLGSLLIPFTGLYALLCLKRCAMAPASTHSVPARVK